MRTEVHIDPNVRVQNNETFAGFEDVRGPFPQPGDRVVVRETESNVIGCGRITRVSHEDRIVYLAVDWSDLHSDVPPTPEEFMATLGKLAVPVVPVAAELGGHGSLGVATKIESDIVRVKR
ncbi:hypothetical protein [Nocardia brasiliensis]